MKISKLVAIALTLVLVAPALAAAEPPYPSQVIRVIVPLTPGTTIDILARLFADRLATRLNQSVIVVNRAGAGGLIAAETVANAPADGYTLLFANSGHTILGTLNKKLPFDPIADFKGVTLVGDAPALVVVSPSTGAKSLKEFVDLAKSKPGKLNYGSAGIGTATHLAGSYFALKAGIDMVHVPYKDSTQILTDMAGGRLDAAFVPAAFSLAMLKAGKLRALAIGSKEPMTEPLQIATAQSQGVDYVYSTWYGFLAPAKVPPAVLMKLNDTIAQISAEPEIQAAIKRQGITPRQVGLADFDASIKNDMIRLAPLLKTISQQVGN
jgi:tripartite-type tricarboxylate transporter receptor subunit TctC